MADRTMIPAAQYLRMSTDQQRYSLAFQAAAIARYAEERGFELVRSYFDPGKSGLTLRERPGLQALLSEALRADRDFNAILVMDVSRWGRFQDPDQGAHYEFLCREAGVDVIYCIEPFENDGGPVAAIVKQLKRVMAAEYSRELSLKITAGRFQTVERGFCPGGDGGYGSRRMIVDANLRPRFIMRAGQRKVLRTDSVILVPGPPEELAVVRRIFRAFALKRLPMTRIFRM
jgi:DNA invertase Pin-like site-specific DNA recombinase